jgi:hypothetical protein
MGVAIIVGASVLAVVFMGAFFVKICKDGNRIKICNVMKLDTEPTAIPRPFPGEEDVRQYESAVPVPSGDMKLFSLRAENLSRSLDRRTRKPA